MAVTAPVLTKPGKTTAEATMAMAGLYACLPAIHAAPYDHHCESLV